MITKEEVAQALPVNLKTSATDELVDLVNNISPDPEVAEHIREHFVTFANVLTEGKFKTSSYVEALHYVTYKLMGYSNQDAYIRTFPTRYQNLVAAGTSGKDIAGYVSAYHRGKLVNLIMEKALIPIHVLYQDVKHKAIMVQADLMQNAASEKVRSDAANSILTHLADPAKAAPNVAIQINNNAEMDALKAMMGQLAQQQVDIIEAGVSAKSVAAQPLFGKPKIVENDGTD